MCIYHVLQYASICHISIYHICLHLHLPCLPCCFFQHSYMWRIWVFAPLWRECMFDFTMVLPCFTMVLPWFTIILIIPHIEFLWPNLPLRLTWAPARPAPNPDPMKPRDLPGPSQFASWCKEMMLKRVQKKWTLHDMTLRYYPLVN